jgi:hypothetical protein
MAKKNGKRRGQGKRKTKCHLRGMLLTACVRGICHEFIKIYCSTSKTEELKVFRK